MIEEKQNNNVPQWYGRAYLNAGLMIIIVFMAVYWSTREAILFGCVVLLSNLIWDLYKYGQYRQALDNVPRPVRRVRKKSRRVKK